MEAMQGGGLRMTAFLLLVALMVYVALAGGG